MTAEHPCPSGAWILTPTPLAGGADADPPVQFYAYPDWQPATGHQGRVGKYPLIIPSETTP